jgi:hypothetical protein
VGRIGVTTSRLISPWNRDISLRIMAKAIPWVSLSRYLARAMREMMKAKQATKAKDPKRTPKVNKAFVILTLFYL